VRPTIRLVQWLHLSGEEKVLGFQIVVPPMLENRKNNIRYGTERNEFVHELKLFVQHISYNIAKT
jgi:hypothetical protein